MVAAGAANSAFGGQSGAGLVKKSFSGSPVALTKGGDRRKNALAALEMIEKEIRAGIESKHQVVIKPNLTRVKKDEWLASTHVDSVWAICEMISSFYNGRIIIAEGTGPGTPLQEALESFEYPLLKKEFNVEFVDLRLDGYTYGYVLDTNMRPIKIRMSKLLLDPDNFLISAAVLKTHALSVITLGLKNIALAVPMNFDGKENDRRKLHKDDVSADPRPLNFNLFQMAQIVAPDLVTIDGFIGMEGEGPLNGDPVESNLAIAGMDWLAADRVGAEVMGFDFERIGHYCYCAEAGMGEANLGRIKVLGEAIGNCSRTYKPSASYESILI
jgi:uncharacterized protein (DUF362 family)